MSSSDSGQLEIVLRVAGAALGPVAGFIGTKIKKSFDRRDSDEKNRRLIVETSRLVEFASLLEKSSELYKNSDLLNRARTTLQNALDQKLSEVVATFSSEQITAVTTVKRSGVDRAFLLYRPARAWGWILHMFYYALIGTTVFGSIGLWADRAEGDTIYGIIGMAVLLLAAVGVNIIANRLDKLEQDRNRSTSHSPAEAFVLVMLYLSGILAIVWVSAQVVFGVSRSLYGYSESAWVICLPFVFYAWRLAQQTRQAAPGASANLTRRSLVIIVIAFVILLAVFLLTIVKAAQGNFPSYSVGVRGSAVLVCCMAALSCFKSHRMSRNQPTAI